MKILMLGNGFDLEHELPTKYTQFLDFLNVINTESDKKNNDSDTQIDEYIYKILNNRDYFNIYNTLKMLCENNKWISYFQIVRKNNLRNKQNWIDFEREIRSIVEKLDDLVKYYAKQREQITHSTELAVKIQRKMNELQYILNDNDMRSTTIEESIDLLVFDLNRLIAALEIYIWEYVGNYNIVYYNPDIAEIRPNKIFSFNYSNTYQKLYGSSNLNVEYLYVHGKAEDHIINFSKVEMYSYNDKYEILKKNLEKCNMVLGIDEYLSEERRDKETRFIEFKKYYQRIYKKNGNEYKKWLDRIADSNSREKNILYIFGHSLDETDSDILREFITCEGLNTVIFYRNKTQLGQQISNLVKVIGYETLIEKVYGKEPSIEFREQKKRKKIENSEFEITTDLGKIRETYSYSTSQIQQLLEKINNKINNKHLRYFCSQEMVITLYDELQRIGLSSKYYKKLINIAKELKPLRRNKKIDFEKWAYADYRSSYPLCDPDTRIFIKKINEYNSSTNSEDKNMEYDWYEFCKMVIDKKRKITEDTYRKLVEEGFQLLDEECYNEKFIWQTLVKVSIEFGTSERILKILQSDKNGDIETIRISHLLSEVDEETFLLEKADTILQ